MKRRIGACQYFECSAETGEGVQELFEHVASVPLLDPKARKKEWRLRTLQMGQCWASGVLERLKRSKNEHLESCTVCAGAAARAAARMRGHPWRR